MQGFRYLQIECSPNKSKKHKENETIDKVSKIWKIWKSELEKQILTFIQGIGISC